MADPILKTLPELTAAGAISDTDLLPIYQGASPMKRTTAALVSLYAIEDAFAFVPTGTGAVARTVASKLQESKSVEDYKLASDSDWTDAYQRAFDDLVAGEFGELILPDFAHSISDSIKINASSLTGKRIQGCSRNLTRITQTTDNTPIFEFTGVVTHHTIDWSHFSVYWANPQDGNTDATIFKWSSASPGSGSIYECTFTNVFSVNGYYFAKTSNTLFWGNAARDVWFGTRGGFVDLNGSAGNPKVIWDNVYITGGSSSETLFKVNAMDATYDVEVNGTSAAILLDGSGGTHTINRFSIETASYSGTKTLFNFANSKLFCFGQIYTRNITLAAASSIIVFSGGASGTGSSRGFVRDYDFAITTQPADAVWTVANFTSESGRKLVFDDISGTFSAYGATPVIRLFNYPSTASGEHIEVRRWNDPGLEVFVKDADYTATDSGPRTILFGKALTAARKVVLPSLSGTGQNKFGGWKRTVKKLTSAGTGFDIGIYRSDGVTLVTTILAATATQSVTVRFDRTDPADVSGSLGYWTVEP